MSDAKSITYKLRAEYEGKGEIKKLSADLKSLEEIKVFQGMEEQFSKTNKDFVDAKKNVRELNKELKASKDPQLAKTLDKVTEKVAGFSSKQKKLSTTLPLIGRELALATDKFKKYDRAMGPNTSEKAVQQYDRLKNKVEALSIRYDKGRAALDETNIAMAAGTAKAKELAAAYKKSSDPAALKKYKLAAGQVKTLSGEIKIQKEALDATRQSMQKSGVEVSDLAGEYQKLQSTVAKQGGAMAARETLGVRSFKDVKQEMAGLEKAYKDLKQSGTASTSELALAKEKLRQKTERLNTEMGKGVKRYSAISTSMGSMRTSAIGLVAPVTALLGVAGVMGIGFGLSNMITDVVRAEKELGNMSRTAGQSVSDFQAFSFGVQSVGMDADKLADISKDVKDKIGDFVETGGGEFKDFFENVASKVGLTAEALLKLSGPDALIAVKKAMDEANISAENQVFYLESIANDASLLIPLLANNGAEWKKLASQAKEMGIAISDLDHSKLMELSKTLSELQLALGVTKREIVLALAPALKDMAQYFSENREELQAFVAGLAEGAGEIMTWIIENRELIVTLGKLSFGVLAVSTAGGALMKTISLVSGAMALLSGSQLVAKMVALRSTVGLLSASFLGTAGTVGLVVAAVGVAVAGIVKFASHYSELKQLNAEIEGQAKSNATAQKQLAGSCTDIGQATGVTVSSMEELDAAVKAGEIHFDEATASWVAGSGEMAASTKKTAAIQKQATIEVTDAMEAEWKGYADTINGIQDSITGRQRSLKAELSAMNRTGMSGTSAWRDQKREAQEYEQAAKIAAKAGNFDAAIANADKAKAAYKALNHEVKDGDKVVVSGGDALKTSMAGVKSAGLLAIDILKQQEEQAKKAADALNFESGWQMGEAFTEAGDEAKKLAEQSGEVGKKWRTMFIGMEKDASQQIKKIAKDLDELAKDRTANLYIKEIQASAIGGMIGYVQKMATGGGVGFKNALNGLYLRGYGGGDRRHVLAEDGEVMIRKEMVASAGPKAALAFNAGQWGVVVSELVKRFNLNMGDVLKRRTGGFINSTPNLSGYVQKMAAGGMVAGGGVSETININLSLPGAVAPVSLRATKSNAEQLLRDITRMQRLASS